MKPHLLPALIAATVMAVLTSCTNSDADDGATTPPSAAAPPLEHVAPALAAYDTRTVQQLWTREGLSPRDRSLVTVATLIATGQTSSLPPYIDRALNDGVTAPEISETLTHLAFYAGWLKAMAAVPGIAAAFQNHGVDPTTLPAADPTLLPLDQEAEQGRDRQVSSDFGDVSPGVVDATRDVLFRDLWLRPDLAPRDRGLVTVSALTANGQSAQITFHLGRAMDNGLTRPEVGETLTQLAYFAGWPNVFSALPEVRRVLDARN